MVGEGPRYWFSPINDITITNSERNISRNDREFDFTEEQDSPSLSEVIRPSSIVSGTENYDSDEPDKSYITTRERLEDEDNDDHFFRRLSCVEEDSVYVAVEKGQFNMDALFWVLTSDFLNPTTIVFLVHILPETRYIPSPLGFLPKHTVNPEIVEIYMTEEREKAKAFLKKSLDSCSCSFDFQNKVYAMLIESDSVEKTILNLIPYLDIKKLVLCTQTNKTSSRWINLRKYGIAHKILMNASKACDVKIVREGKEVMDHICASPLSSPSSFWPRKSKSYNGGFHFEPAYISKRNIFWAVLRE